MPIVWIARLLSLPIKKRIAGSDILDELRTREAGRKLRVFFFGGADGTAETARRILNGENGGLTCVGTLNPGHGTVDDMSNDAIFTAINGSNADFLVVALGAGKGQAWLLRKPSSPPHPNTRPPWCGDKFPGWFTEASTSSNP